MQSLTWIIDLNIKAQTIKHPEENIRKNIGDLGLGKDFLKETQSMNYRKCCFKN